ncbi:MAG: hypothetical protein QOJ68_3065 [Blastococcus sp.]|jgi:hypothetical protein|nr:hypothetical protein [Blastococcus sp.]
MTSQPPPGYGYPPPAYGQPYSYGPPPTNPTAIAALVLAFVVPPAGIVMGISARRQIRRTGEQGGGLALAGIILGSIATGLYVLLIVFWLVVLAALTSGSFGP